MFCCQGSWHSDWWILSTKKKKCWYAHVTDFAYHSWISPIKSPDLQLSAFRDCCFLFVAGEELVFEHCIFLGNVSLTFDFLFLGTFFWLREYLMLSRNFIFFYIWKKKNYCRYIYVFLKIPPCLLEIYTELFKEGIVWHLRFASI